jgi:hypothetical protein
MQLTELFGGVKGACDVMLKVVGIFSSGMGWALSLRDFDASVASWQFDFADGGLLWWEKVQRVSPLFYAIN